MTPACNLRPFAVLLGLLAAAAGAQVVKLYPAPTQPWEGGR